MKPEWDKSWTQGVYLKKTDREAQLIFLGLKFLIFLFFGFGKTLVLFGVKRFFIYSLGNNCDIISFIFLDVQLNDLETAY